MGSEMCIRDSILTEQKLSHFSHPIKDKPAAFRTVVVLIFLYRIGSPVINTMKLRGKLDPCLKILWGFIMSTEEEMEF